ncbi:MAG: hypothetical protein QOK38_206 [Acidobacteriaceae bacterium]|jgi:hypothetical protein|nr:hypothetical protein [Acidobacteriaceae bacterium]
MVFVVLKGSLAHAQGLHNRQQRATALAALFGLIYVGLNLYRIIGTFHSVLAVNAFYFAENLFAGMSIAMAISVFAPKRAQFVLSGSGVLLIGMNSLVIARHELKHFASTIRGFSTVNGLLLGISIPLTIFLWRRSSSEVTDTYE